ncbi:universal stress protein [Streptomyces sp. RB6PN25]|uniref:Universal stress protein n=1 Tax=Streptomyces humicola TaxID=2953240 RepID=A0ABT1Q4G2_9ACTN|nr:universal stress protein [Streptomyces humicola]MCQ4084813.1 universal stress protein [Streptomyces humicola]
MADQEATVPRIVVGVDGSEPSKAALRWALRHAELTSGVVEAVIAWEFPYLRYGYGWTPPTAGADELFDYEGTAEVILTRAIDEVVGTGGRNSIRTRVARGNAAAVLLEAARGAELLVVGNRGHGGFAEALLGSVGQHCVQHAPCPVVVIRGQGAHGRAA